MKIRSICHIITIIICLILLLPLGINNACNDQKCSFSNIKLHENNLEKIQRRSTHDPIIIDDDPTRPGIDRSFATTAANEGWSGDGSNDNPYIIEGFSISNSQSDSIKIQNSDKHFVIKDCDISIAGRCGIYFYKAKNGLIQNVVATGCKDDGIWLDDSSNIKIDQCQFSNNKNTGITLMITQSISVMNTEVCENGFEGFRISSSGYVQIQGCEIWANSKLSLTNGVYVHSSTNVKINECNIYENGIGVWNHESDPKYKVDAKNNWWGSESGPSMAGSKTSSKADSVNENIDYKPYWKGKDGIEEEGDFPITTVCILASSIFVVGFMILIIFIIWRKRKR